MDEEWAHADDAERGSASLISPIDTSAFSRVTGLSNATNSLTESAQKALANAGLEASALSLFSNQASTAAEALNAPARGLPDHTLDGVHEIPSPNYTIPNLASRDLDIHLYPKPNWQQLIILGNGFDLQCGLRSRFGDFFRSRFERIESIQDYSKETWKSLIKDSDLTVWDFILEANIDGSWCDVEGTIESWVLSAAGPKTRSSLFWCALNCMKEFPFTDRLPVIVKAGSRLAGEEDDRSYLLGNIARYVWTLFSDNHRYTSDMFIGLLRQDLGRLERFFGDYLSREITNDRGYAAKCKGLYRAIDEDGKQDGDHFCVSTSVLSFNYTSQIEDFFDKGDDGVFVNIHGKLGEEIVFGIDGKDCMDDSIAVPFTKTYRLMLRGGTRTDGLISTANSSNLQDATDIIKFYGHSLGKADYSYFQSIFDGVDLYESKTALVFYYPYDDSEDGEKNNNEWRERLANSINDLLVAYGATMDNADHGKNLMHKLLLEGRLIIRGVQIDS